MPIVRSYFCEDCAHTFSVTLSSDQVDAEPPDCPHCSGATAQDFKPVAIRGAAGQARKSATEMAETIAREDYGVADMTHNKDAPPKVRYNNTDAGAAKWERPNQEMLNAFLAEGRATRQQFGGSGLDVLKANLESGAQPDLIEISKKRSARVY